MTEQPLKPGWQMYRFDQIAVNVNERIEPGDTDAEYYVGLEHLDSDSLKIRRWGEPSDVEATKLRFKTGDIIFGRRRVYQRKLAVAEFDGICSAHAMVLRPKTEVVLPEFLPFFMQSDMFMNRALEISVGSLSPTINWRTLAQQEFPLPPLAEQRRLAEVLSASYQTYESISEAIRAGHNLRYSIVDSRILGEHKNDRLETPFGLLPSSWPIVRLNTALKDTQYGLSITPLSEGDYPLLRMMNIEDGEVVENDIKYVNLSDKEFESYRLNKGDVLFNRTNSYELVGRTGIYNVDGDHVFASYLVRIITDRNKLLPEYLVAYLNSSPGRQQVLSFATKGVSQTNVNASNLGKVVIPLPPIEEQVETITFFESLRRGINLLEDKLKKAHQIYKNLSQEVLM